MLGFGAASMLGGSSLQCLDHILSNASYEELRHYSLHLMITHDSVPMRNVQIGVRGGAAGAGALDTKIR